MGRNKKTKDGFPLWFHKPSGQWCKTVKGVRYYFGPNKDEAAKRWFDERDGIFAGKRSILQSGTPTVKELLNLYHAAMKESVSQGKITQRHFVGIDATLKRFVAIVGGDVHLDTIDPLEWDRVRSELFKPAKSRVAAKGGTIPRNVPQRSPTTVDGDIRRITAFVRWCESKRKIPAIDLADCKPSDRRECRIRKAKAGKRHLSREAILAILEQAKPTFKPIILLGINSGVGALDIAGMRLWHIEKIQDPHEVWIDLFRGKTGGERRFALWPETKQAIVDYLAIRPKPAIGVDAELLFLNQQGRPWVNSKSNAHFDGIGTRFSELRKAAGIPRGTFYDLRRTFATIASETNDTEGLRHLMGFVAPKNDMLAEYIQAVFDYRLKRITDHVREWLFGKPSRKPSQKRGAK